MVIPADGARPLAVDLLALALVPAVAEELLFRGVLFGAARPRLGATGAVVASAVAFGALSRIGLPLRAGAAFGGLLLGTVRAASGSLWPAIAFHFANNAGVIVALHLGYDSPRPPPRRSPPPSPRRDRRRARRSTPLSAHAAAVGATITR